MWPYFFILIILVCVVLFQKKSASDYEKEILEALDEGLAIVDHKRRCIFFNSKFFRLIKAHQIKKNQPFDSIATTFPQLLQECVDLLQKAQAGSEELLDAFFLKKEEYEMAISIRVKKLSNQHIAVVLHDKDPEKREFALGKEFIANASHELRTPITIIKGFIETLRDLPEVSDAMLEDIFEKILRNCKRMEEMVKNLLILTDLDHLFSLQKKPVDFLLLADNLKHNLLQLYPHAAVEILCLEKEAIAAIDKSLVELALLNLMHNAVKYSKESPKIEIEVQKKDQELMVSISDQGIGIPKENLPFIFERFYSVDKTLSRKLGGAGLGLSIVKKILDKHQGTIFVEENPYGGTIFRLHFPL